MRKSFNKLVINKNIKIFLFAAIFFGIFGMAQNSEAATYYVAQNGHNGATGLNNTTDASSGAWATPQHAWYTAQAGDTVYFRGGTYTISGQIDTARTSGYDGRSDAWIEFTRYENESVTIKGTNTGLQAMFKIGRDYNYIHDINFDGNGDNRIFMVGYDTNNSVEGFRIENCTLTNWANGDNCTALYLGESWSAVRASNLIVKNNTIIGRADANHHNYCGIMVFGADDYQIENNEVSQISRGIYLKHSSISNNDTGKTVKNNWVHDQHNSDTGHLGALAISDNYVTVSNNIGHYSIIVGEDGQGGAGAPRGTHCTIDHNTMLTYGFQFYQSNPNSSYNTITNNLFLPSATQTNYGTGNVFNYNLYGSGSKIGSNDVVGTPTFAAGSGALAYALAAGSVGKNAASGGKDMGADVTLVGVDAGGGEEEDNTPPSAPSGLSVS